METRKLHIQMPIGYRFCPTDEEIIIHYLRPKVFSFPLPSPTIIHSYSFHLFLHHPATLPLPGDPKEKRYFFCKTSFNHHHHHASGGYWKPIIKKKKKNHHHNLIVASGCNHPIGFKKSFVFYQFSKHNPTPSRTPWILHQFHLLYPIPLPLKMEEEWVVCSIQFKSKKNPRTQPFYNQSRPRYTYEDERLMQDVIEHDSTTISDTTTGFDKPAASTSSSGITFNHEMEEEKEEEEAVVS